MRLLNTQWRRQHNLKKRRLKRPAVVQQSERGETKARLREKAQDQVALDKLNGLEHGATCYLKYREAMAKAAKEPKPNHRSKRRKPIRDAGSYRGARKNDERGTRRSHALRAERKAKGQSRREHDMWRFIAIRLEEAA